MVPTDFTERLFKYWRSCLALASDGSDSRKHLLSLYDYLLTNAVSPAIYRKIGCSKSRPRTFILSSGHVGQMGGKFPLSPTQRQAVGHYVGLADDSVLAVNGPPGTGKTTYIQSLVANSVVESALRGQEPSIIVATSATNQAITNIIASFSSAGIVQRWLPDIASLGLYLTNARQAGEYKITNLLSNRGEGSISKLFAPEYCKLATEHFLACCNAHFGTHLSSIGKAKNYIHTALKQGQSDYKSLTKANNKRVHIPENLQSGIDNINQQISTLSQQIEFIAKSRSEFQTHLQQTPSLLTFFSFLPFVRRKITERNHSFLVSHGIGETVDNFADAPSILAGKASKLEEQKSALVAKLKPLTDALKAEENFRESCQNMGVGTDLATIDNELDTGHRAAMFELAVHYWEARFLEGLKGGNADSPEKIRMGEGAVLGRYRTYAMVFPIFISTGYSLPKFFNYYKQGDQPILGGIDLLIFDEAGQIPPEVGGVLFSLCKKSVVVGDTQQIEPIVTRGVQDIPCDVQDGLKSGSGSLMSVAHMMTEISYDGKTPGLILTEHRRCLPAIIGYCNELAYSGILQPLRTGPPGLFPPMSMVDVSGLTVHVDDSHYCYAEATAIVEWILNNKKGIEEFYRKKVHSCLAVITPFRPQMELIIEQLKLNGLSKITVGTNHAMQGAERNIILFSAVCDKSTPPTFINEKPNPLNVAVSRAKDTFVLFGDNNMLTACPPDSPLGLLRTRLQPLNGK